MAHTAHSRLALLLVACLLHYRQGAGAPPPAKPHIVTIILDDWGWNNFGIHAKGHSNEAEVRTPNLDKLAAEGIVLDRHYVASICTPTRSAFQTGRNPVHVTTENDMPWLFNPSDPETGFTGIPRSMTGIAARGYSTFLGYLFSGNNYWSYANGDGAHCRLQTPLIDLWQNDAPALGLKPDDYCSYEKQDGCTYEDELFEEHVKEVIGEHNAGDPLFLVWSPHAAHTPLAPPNERVADFEEFGDDHGMRQLYAATVDDIDMRIGRVVDTLKAAGMWDNTLLVVTADNGGATAQAGGASNYPLRGGKYCNLEGGVRANAFVAGGLIPEGRKGTVATGLIAIEDWYATFCHLAGVEPKDDKAQAAGLPGLDSINVWPYLSGDKATSPRKEVVLGINRGDFRSGPQAVIDDKGYKLIFGGKLQPANWSAPVNPISSTLENSQQPELQCGGNRLRPPFTGACLFNVFDDPSERTDLAKDLPGVVARLGQRLLDIQKTSLTLHPGPDIPPKDYMSLEICKHALTNLKGFEGPRGA